MTTVLTGTAPFGVAADDDPRTCCTGEVGSHGRAYPPGCVDVVPSQAQTSNPECGSRHNTTLRRGADRAVLASSQTCHDHHESTLQPRLGISIRRGGTGHHNLAAAVGECLGRGHLAAISLAAAVT